MSNTLQIILAIQKYSLCANFWFASYMIDRKLDHQNDKRFQKNSYTNNPFAKRFHFCRKIYSVNFDNWL